jgi:hypothetical protein
MYHHVHHFGNTESLYREGKMSKEGFAAVIEHFIKVNGCTRRDFLEHNAEAGAQWREQSARHWDVSYGAYESEVRADREKKASRTKR